MDVMEGHQWVLLDMQEPMAELRWEFTILTHQASLMSEDPAKFQEMLDSLNT